MGTTEGRAHQKIMDNMVLQATTMVLQVITGQKIMDNMAVQAITRQKIMDNMVLQATIMDMVWQVITVSTVITANTVLLPTMAAFVVEHPIVQAEGGHKIIIC